MLRFPVKPRPKDQLKKMADPQAVPGGQAEALPWILYDTVEYVSGTTQQLTLFTESRNNRNLTNLDTPGQLSDPNYFQLYYMGLDVQLPPLDGAWSDLNLLLQGAGTDGGPTFELTISDKSYGRFPLPFLHESGGQRGFGFSTETDDAVEYARNGPADGGWCVDGAIVIPPLTGFRVQLRWSEAQTLANENTDLRLWMAGNLYRRVL